MTKNAVNIEEQTIPAKKFAIITYGCQMNENDSERFAGQLKTIGYELSDSLEQADLIMINTCCVRESAENKIYGKIGELKKFKAVNPNLLIGISGCMAQKEGKNLLKNASHVDFVIGTHNVHKLAELVTEMENAREKIVAVWEQAEESIETAPSIRKGQVSAYVPIMYGCNNFCTYCIVPYVRGRERSRSQHDILQEIHELSHAGFKEITLLGQNVNSYGSDTEKYGDFADLLQAADKIEHIERIRFMTSHPRDMNEKVIHTIKNSKKICHHFHLPIQSGSDALLEKMNRGYTTKYYQNLVNKIRETMPHASLTTDIIVGFPGETEELFEETLQFLQTIRFDAAYTFLYSKRSGTPAATMTDQVPTVEKKNRLQRLMNIQNDISLEINKQYENQIVEVLIEGTSKTDSDKLMGRTASNKIVLWENTGCEEMGQLANVTITNAQTWVLKGNAAL